MGIADAAALSAIVHATVARCPDVERLKRIRIIGQAWLPGGDELTPTRKLERHAIATKYAAAVDALYAEVTV